MLIFIFWIAMTISVTSNNYHHLVYSDVRARYFYGFTYLKYTPKILYYVYIYGLCIMMFLCDIMIILRTKGKKGIERRRLIYLFVVAVIPSVAFIINKRIFGDKLDLVSISFSASTIFLIVLVQKYGLLDMIQLAKETIVENTKEGLLVVDTEYNLLYANPIVKEKYKGLLESEDGDCR